MSIEWTSAKMDNHSGHWMNNWLSVCDSFTYKISRCGKNAMDANHCQMDGFRLSVTLRRTEYNVKYISQNKWNEILPQTCLNLVVSDGNIWKFHCFNSNNGTTVSGLVALPLWRRTFAVVQRNNMCRRQYLFHFWICGTCAIQGSRPTNGNAEGLTVINCIRREHTWAFRFCRMMCYLNQMRYTLLMGESMDMWASKNTYLDRCEGRLSWFGRPDARPGVFTDCDRQWCGEPYLRW